MNTLLLNKLLARWAGVEVRSPSGWGVASNRENVLLWKTPTPNPPYRYGIYAEWDPLTDGNQMELVKARLRKAGYGYEITWAQGGNRHRAEVFRPHIPIDLPLAFCGYHTSEAMALALAIKAMEQGK